MANLAGEPGATSAVNSDKSAASGGFLVNHCEVQNGGRFLCDLPALLSLKNFCSAENYTAVAALEASGYR